MKTFIFSFLLCFIVLLLPIQTKAQYKLSAAIDGLVAFNTNEVYLQSNLVEQSLVVGYGAYAINEYQMGPHSIRSVLGFKSLYGAGTYNNQDFEVETYKLILGLGYSYNLNEKLKLATGIEMENNLDFNNLRGQTAELFRSSFTTQLEYTIFDDFSVYLLYYRALSPIFDTYLIYNPENQFRLGISYRIL